MASSRLNTKAAVFAVVLLGVLVAILAGVWVYPPALVYGVIAGGALMAYVAVYFIVVGALRRERISDAPASERARR
jgi:hypothetical protein